MRSGSSLYLSRIASDWGARFWMFKVASTCDFVNGYVSAFTTKVVKIIELPNGYGTLFFSNSACVPSTKDSSRSEIGLRMPSILWMPSGSSEATVSPTAVVTESIVLLTASHTETGAPLANCIRRVRESSDAESTIVQRHRGVRERARCAPRRACRAASMLGDQVGERDAAASGPTEAHGDTEPRPRHAKRAANNEHSRDRLQTFRVAVCRATTPATRRAPRQCRTNHRRGPRAAAGHDPSDRATSPRGVAIGPAARRGGVARLKGIAQPVACRGYLRKTRFLAARVCEDRLEIDRWSDWLKKGPES